jgi:ABC-type transport system substrate-binding protein
MGGFAAAELGLPFKQLATPGRAAVLADDEALKAADRAEKLLNQAIAEHDSAVQRKLRVGSEWNERFRKPLVQARTNVRLGRVDLWIAQQKQQQAEIECDRIAADLTAADPLWADLHARLERILDARSQALLAKGDYPAARELLERYAARFGRSPGPVAQKLQEALAAKAGQMLREADSLKASAPQKAVELVTQAATVWPTAAGLEDSRRGIVEGYPILRCAYPELPNDLCPLTARTAADRHASALVCEGLVRWVDDPQSGAHFESQLVAGHPFPLVRGRGFRLPRVKWSDSTDADVQLCTVEDVRFTVRLLQTPEVPGYSPIYAGLLKGVDNAEGDDPFTALVRLTRDHWQPLSLMDFRILPWHYFAAAKTPTEIVLRLKEFGQNPVGTGPYRLVRDPQDGPDVRRLVANPHYRVAGLPKIREIAFERHDAVKAVDLFLQKRIHVIYDVRPEHVNQLRQQGQRVVALKTPSVWFLAPNYDRKAMQNGNLRLAIACAIDREAILKQYFRPGQGTADHAALSGPYPRDSWANNPAVEPFPRAKAKALAGLAARELNQPLKFRLVYPGGSPEVESACKQIETQLQEAGISLELKALDPATYYAEVTGSREFDLAYWNYFYPDSTYWVEPLLNGGPAGTDRSGWNAMRFRPDDELAGLFRDVRLHKSFLEIQKLTHRIHEHVARSAAIIPLWQLDTYVAIGPGVKEAGLDPLVLFSDAGAWRLEVKK